MVVITYSQPKLKKRFGSKIRRLFNLVKTRSTPDLWIKVFIKRLPKERWMRYGWGLNGERDSAQIKFFFGNRFKFEDISKQSDWTSLIRCNGHYRWVEAMGFYDKEWKFLNDNPKIKHVITLKIGENSTDEIIAGLIAHEFRHYLQYRKYGRQMISRESYNGRRKRPVQVERDANKWANKRIEQLKEKVI